MVGTRVRCGDGIAVDADLVRRGRGRARPTPTPRWTARHRTWRWSSCCGPEPEDVAAALERAGELSGATTVLGCSAPGVIGGGRGVELTSSVSVWLARLPGVHLRSFHLEVLRTSETIAVVGMPTSRSDDRAAVLLVDPYSFPVDAFVEQTARRPARAADQRGQRVRAARSRAPPGCSSTAWCTTAVPSGWCWAVTWPTGPW